jgi:hypothetical protein
LKEEAFLSGNDRYTAKKENFTKIPGCPVAYWVSEQLITGFELGKPIEKISNTRQGIIPGNIDAFVRLWYEVDTKKIGFGHTKSEEISANGYKWFPYNKGGSFRRWYGNIEHLINMENDGYAIKNSGLNNNYRLREPELYFQDAVTWSKISSGAFSARYMPIGCLFDIAGCCIFELHQRVWFVLGLLNSCVGSKILNIISPTLNYEIDHIKKVPVITSKHNSIDNIVKSNVELAKVDWNSFETSWDFKTHPLVQLSMAGAFAWGDNKPTKRLRSTYKAWELLCEGRFNQLKANEEELNRIFIDIYGLQDELTPEVEDKDVTVYRIFDSKEDIPESMAGSRYALTKQDAIKSFISYAVGCMFGRYSLDVEGLAYAGGEWDSEKYRTFVPDKDNILPICDDEYFDDDIVGRFVDFVRAVYGEDTLEENLKFIADALGGNGTSREVIRNYFLKDFYKDHCKTYQKRPIYWLFDSGKKNGFKALIYMHRYSRDLLAKLRTDYVHEQQERYRTQLSHIAAALNTATGAERARLLKQQDKLTEQLKEITAFEEKVHHLADQNIEIDLDDGVKKNYEIFADVLAKI